MSVVPVFRSIVGEGKPRLIVVRSQNTWASFGTTTYTATSVTEALGSTVAITSSNSADYIDTGAAHGLLAGDRFVVAGHTGSTPDINGEHRVVRVDSSTRVTIETNITAGGTGGTLAKAPNFDYIMVGMRVNGLVTRAGFTDGIVYARVTGVDKVNKVLTVDEWVGGTPTNGKAYAVNGHVINLPFAQEMVQTFQPRQLLHEIWRGKIEGKFWGYNYGCVISYATFIAADTLYLLGPAMTLGENDSLVLVPHRDKPQYNYGVRYDNSFSLAKFGIAGGHKGFAFSFRGTYIVQFPISASGYGFNYALTYGTGK